MKNYRLTPEEEALLKSVSSPESETPKTRFSSLITLTIILILMIAFGYFVYYMLGTSREESSEKPDLYKELGLNVPEGEDTASVYARRTAFFTYKLQLSPREAETFWPVYNEYCRERAQLKAERKVIFKDMPSEMDSVAYNDLIDRYAKISERRGEMLRRYAEEFAKILPYGRATQVFICDKEFERSLNEDNN